MPSRGTSPHGDAGRAAPTFAEKLNHLLHSVPVGGTKLSSEGLAQAVSALGSEHKLSPDYVRKLRRGESDNPTLRLMEGIARVFGVQPSYFTDNDEAAIVLHENLALVAALQDKNIRSIALRTSQLSPSTILAIVEIVKALDNGADGEASP